MDNRDSYRHNVLTSGHRACAGCGEAIAARMVTDLIGPNAIYVNATGSLQAFTTNDNQSAWQAPWIHSVFANAASVASGIEAALRLRGEDTMVVVQAGDGGSFDIGLQGLSGMIERGHNVLFVCYDTEDYMNTSLQRFSSTRYAEGSKISSEGVNSRSKQHIKKDFISIIAVHRIPYTATATIAFFPDLKAKVDKAINIKGPRFLHLLCPCPQGWGYDASQTITASRLAVESGLFPLVEFEYGELTGVMRLTQQQPVNEYLQLQGRFKHLFDNEQNAGEIRHLQAIADTRVQHYGLLTADTEWDNQQASQVMRHGRGGYKSPFNNVIKESAGHEL